MKEPKRKSAPPEDDGRVIVNMDVDGFSWYSGKRQDEKKKKNDPDKPTAKETRALIFAAYRAYLPYFLIVLGVFVLVFLLGWLYLSH